MAAVERDLIRPEDGVALLFKPRFDKTILDPGYIKGDPPDVRENGGQYPTQRGRSSPSPSWAKATRPQIFSQCSILSITHEPGQQFIATRWPYVVAADLYAVAPHVGRGGWIWYTGSAGWMQRAGMESILGLRVRSGTLTVDPCIPTSWPKYTIVLRYRTARYVIDVEDPMGVSQGVVLSELDGMRQENPTRFPLVDGGAIPITHRAGKIPFRRCLRLIQTTTKMWVCCP